MIRTALRYHRPQSLSDASDILLQLQGDVAILGGGTQLLPRLTRNVAEVSNIVDLADLGLERIAVVDGRISLGAKATYADVLDSLLLATDLPLLQRMARGVTGGRQLTQQATLVGAACFGFPSADAPGALVALRGDVDIHGPDGTRSVPVEEFLVDAFVVGLDPGELVTSVSFDSHAGGGYCKVKHSAGSWPIATASAVRDATTGDVRLALGAVQAVPVVVDVADPTDAGAVTRAVEAAINAPWSDVMAPGAYRAQIAPVVARRAIDDLLGA